MNATAEAVARTVTTETPNFDAIKAKQKATWEDGDYADFAKYMEAGAIEIVDTWDIGPDKTLLDVGCALLSEEVDFFGLEQKLDCPVRRLEDGEEVRVGKLSLAVRHTPGTPPGASASTRRTTCLRETRSLSGPWAARIYRAAPCALCWSPSAGRSCPSTTRRWCGQVTTTGTRPRPQWGASGPKTRSSPI